MKLDKILILSSLCVSLNATQTALEPITVTAQKSEQDSQKVPISLSVFNDIDLEDKQISTLDELGHYVPNFLLFQVGQQALSTASIRGISANILSYSAPVSLYVDGIPTMNSFGFFDALGNVERIEVLRGPQGVLYGKNSEAGVINIVTKEPTNELKASVFTTIGTHGKREIGASVSSPIVKDKFYFGLYLNHTQKDGFMKDTLTGKYANDKKFDYGKINFKFTPTDSLSISLVASKIKFDNGVHDWARGYNKKISPNLKGFSKPTTDSLGLNIKYDINEASKITSTSTYRHHADRALVDADMTPKTLRHIDKYNKYNSYSQEFRYEYDFLSGKFISGLYADKTKDKLFTKIIHPADLTGKMAKHQNLSSNSIGLFANLTYNINDKFSMDFGARFDRENKKLEVEKTPINLEKSWDNISPKLGLTYNISQNSLFYANVAKGYRSGGFNPFAPPTNKTYDEESLISYELGTKNTFLNNRLKLNLSLFYMDIDNAQIEQKPKQGVIYTTNVATAVSKGFEGEINAFLTDEIAFFGTFGLSLSKFKKSQGNGKNYEGNYLPNAPKYNFSTGFTYRNNLGLYASIGVSGYGKTYFDQANKFSQKPYELVNLKIGYEQDSFDVYLYADNVFDKNHDSINAYFNGTTSILREGREVGLKFAYRF